MKAQMELTEAVERYRKGNREEFEPIYSLSYKYLYVCIKHIVKDEETTRDMLQETYLEISRSISQLKNAEDFLNWAAVIARRKCFAHLNKSDKFILSGSEGEGDRPEIFDTIADDEAFIPESIMQDKEKRRLMREIIDGLSDMQRLCVIGYYYNEQRQEEIAEELGIPVNTVKSHLSRAKTKIREEVLTLEKEKDTKLYALAPFMLLFFAEEAQACESVPMADAVAELAREIDDGERKGTDPGNRKPGKAAKLGMKAKIMIGAAVLIGAVSAVVIINAVSEEPKEIAQEAEKEDGDVPKENMEQDPAKELEETEAEKAEEALSSENEQEHKELAISGVYDGLREGRDGIIIARSGEKWGLVTYDNQVLVPFEYDFACQGPNNDGQTFFGNEGDYRVFDREGNEIFKSQRPIKAVSEGIVLWVETVEDWTYLFGYVKLDGTVLYESTGEDVDGQAGAVGFGEGYAFSTNGNKGTEYRFSPDGTVADIFEMREVLRHPELLEEVAQSERSMSTADSAEGNLFYPIGACYQGYYVDMGITFFEDTNGQFYVYDAEGTEQYWLRMESVADYAGYSWWEDEDLSWRIRGFYYNGNFCYSSKTIAAVSMTSGEDTKCYLIDIARQEKREEWDGSERTVVTDQAVLFEGEYVEISDAAYWLMKQDGQWGYVDHDGSVIARFDDATRFCKGKAMVIQAGSAYFVDEDMNPGEWKIPAESVASYGEVYAVTTAQGQKCYTASE